ncbi:MAG TPA: NAD-glutamate dehydrogenase, partial [Propionibacteriaceae bacterium]|nr:NAD-glutamate dehydrogenase [Propionibacteriaceae bacterium]
SGYDRESHGGKAILATLDSFPRDELFLASVDELAGMIEPISRLKERRRVRVFVRRGTWGRFISCLVYLPRDRYNTDVRLAMMRVIVDFLGAESVEYQAQVTESVLARLYFVAKMPDDAPSGEVDVPALETRLADVARGWDDHFSDLASALASEQRGVDFPTGYKSDFSPAQGVADLLALNALGEQPDAMGQAMVVSDDPADRADLRLKVFMRKQTMLLSDVMPVLTSLGLTVVDEWPYEITLRGEQAAVYEFGLALPGGRRVSDFDADARRRLMDAFEAAWRGNSEADELNALVATAALTWREVALLRALARFLRQAGTPYSLTYLAEALTGNTPLAVALVRYFQARFDPDRPTDERSTRMASTREAVVAGLEGVASLDHDRILRHLLALIDACVRSNWFVPDAPALTFKLASRELGLLPQPRPAFEIYVYSPRVEGVHLRFGKVARGGLRWSDRAEDYRTEVLGLVKAQMVKNTVIVPVGAKGGFYPRHLPGPAGDRAAWLAEGVACYEVFVGSLLDLTDNLVDGQVVPPARVVRHDDDDPYLVVAADKGTATFSDIANKLSIDRGFWLGDAFASGGSVGYDHKGMGITARGAWESVKRHFAEMGRDCQTEDFTCVGIGDMAGDVFGNGMMLSTHTRLVAAFNHLHILIDPTPDAARTHAERVRLFHLPRSTWADYDTSLLSEGGAIYARSAKSINLSPQARSALGIETTGRMTPNEVIHAILAAPVDLLWNGGIGTYVKAASETHGQVADKANDPVRVNGAEVRALVAGEGGNLGWTQLGRIEYAMSGGRINTDFIDNSAGVDTSDHEVNIKILLAAEIEAGRLTLAERDALLPRMTDDVAGLVLHHNVDQNLALSDAMHGAAALAGVHEDWMARLESAGYLDRMIENMPSTAQMRARIVEGRGLVRPELCSLMAWTKIMLVDLVLASDLPEDPFVSDRLVNYFPPLLRERYRDRMPEHRLHREIITTVAVNRFVNSQGITAFHRLSDETGASAPDVIRAQLAARSIFGALALETDISQAGVDAVLQIELRLALRRLVEGGARWLLRNRPMPLDIRAAIEEFNPGVNAVATALPDLLTDADRRRYSERLGRFVSAAVSDKLARSAAGAVFLQLALALVQISSRTGRDVTDVARVHFLLMERLGLDRLLSHIEEMPRKDRWGTKARSAVRDDLFGVRARLTEDALLEADGSESAEGIVEGWFARREGASEQFELLSEALAGEPDLARISVALRSARGLQTDRA